MLLLQLLSRLETQVLLYPFRLSMMTYWKEMKDLM